MTLHKKDVSISNLVIQCGGLASVMENCLGPHGRAVLMERSGNVTITKDGTELLSSLSVCDPVVNTVTRGVIDQSQLCGDGCKRTLLLLRCLLRSLDYHVSSSSVVSQSVRRQRMLQIVHNLQIHYMCNIQRKVFEFGVRRYPFHNFEALGDILSNSAEFFFSTKFSKLIAKTLSQLFKSYLFCQCSCSGDVIKLLQNVMSNTHIAIVEIYNTPLLKSHVAPGFIVTRDFKYLDERLLLDNVPFIFWSIELEEKGEDDPCKPVIEVSNDESLVESIMIRNKRLATCLALLKSICTCVIFSSIYFPDWAVLQCQKYGFSVIDMIDTEEWGFMTTKLGLNPVTSLQDIQFTSLGILEKVEPVTLGNSRFVRLYGLNVDQIVLCGPTVSQCKQFSSAFCKLFRYLNHWIMDCLFWFKFKIEVKHEEGGLGTNENSPFNNISAKDSSMFLTSYSPSIASNVFSVVNFYASPGNPLPLFYSVPQGGYLPLFAKYLIVKGIVVDNDRCSKIAQSVIVELLNEIPRLLYKKSRLSQERYIEYNTRFDNCLRRLFDENDSYLLPTLFTDFKFVGYENPFELFKILDAVFTFAQSLLRIECIIPSKHRLAQKLRSCVENSDDDDDDGYV